MKRFLCAVAAVAFMVPSGATAQQQSNRDQGKKQTQESQNKSDHRRPSPTSGHKPSQPSHQRPTTKPAKPNRPNHRPPTIQPVQPNRPNHPSRPPTSQPIYRPGHRPSSYHRIRGPVFHYPSGYSYRRWTVGRILPHIFFSNPYYWTNWAALGLGPAPPGYVWVRYGPDLLLVDRRTGRIADVIYGAFY